MRAFWEQCAKMSGDILPYLVSLQLNSEIRIFVEGCCKFQGTAATARDVASMVDAIDGTGSDINYW